MCDLLHIAIKAGNRDVIIAAVCLVVDLSARERERGERRLGESIESTSAAFLIKELMALC